MEHSNDLIYAVDIALRQIEQLIKMYNCRFYFLLEIELLILKLFKYRYKQLKKQKPFAIFITFIIKQ